MHQTNLFGFEPSNATRSEANDRFATLAPTDLTHGEQDSLIRLALQVLEPTVRYDAFTDAESTKRYLQLRFARRAIASEF